MIEILKALHIAAIAGWSAGLLCLPSLYVQRCHVGSRDELHRLQALVRFAYINLVSPLAFVAVASGTALIFARSVVAPWFVIANTYSPRPMIMTLVDMGHAMMTCALIGAVMGGV